MPDMKRVTEKSFAKFIGDSANGLQKGSNYFVESVHGEYAWLSNMWNTLTRVNIWDVVPVNDITLDKNGLLFNEKPIEVLGDNEAKVINDGFAALSYGVGMLDIGHGKTTIGKIAPNGKGLQFGKPKAEIKIPTDQIDAAIDSNEIYRRARAALNDAQREQVGYGMGKYPELLNADTWTILETIKHIKGELVDGLHYLTMLEIKLEQMGEK